ncbi:MAG: GIY-YIG nuclease family protein [Candidatus Marinimicrobia bacterium]|nr:GIY-YIG nuclease family protein [Candidatus Neomarinimicrobiota bacterium]
MPFFTYILFSESHDRYYIGHTDRLEERIIEHNSGHTKSTRYGCPWELVFKREFGTRIEAIRYERYLKSQKSRKFIETLILTG